MSIAAPLADATPNSFQAVNPSTGEYLEGYFPKHSAADVDQAATAAAQVFDEYSSLSASGRAEFLETIATELEARREAIVARGMLETALPDMRLNGELGRTTGQLRLFAETLKEGSWVRATIDTAMPEREPLPRPDIRSRYIAIGPVAVFGASNFPLAFSTAGGDTASALAAGCPVIVKAHSAHPGTSHLVAEAINTAIEKCGLPKAIFTVLYGSGSEVGTELVKHPSIKSVGFTGSTYAGRLLFNLAAARPQPIPFYGELGSINPVFLLPNAVASDPAALAQAYIGSLTLGAGQFCTNPGLLIAISSPELDRFKQAAAEALAQTPSQVMLTEGIAAAYNKGKSQAAAANNVQPLSVGQAESGAGVCASLYTVKASDWLAQKLLHEEVFGPLGLIVECENLDEAMHLADELDGQLTATIHAEEADYEAAGLLSQKLSQCCGRLLFNGWPTGVEVCYAMTHGGPYPASTDSRITSVGSRAIERWVRTVSYQNMPDELLPDDLKASNPMSIWRLQDAQWIK